GPRSSPRSFASWAWIRVRFDPPAGRGEESDGDRSRRSSDQAGGLTFGLTVSPPGSMIRPNSPSQGGERDCASGVRRPLRPAVPTRLKEEPPAMRDHNKA